MRSTAYSKIQHLHLSLPPPHLLMQLPDLFLLLFLEQFQIPQLGLPERVLVYQRCVVIAVKHLLRGAGLNDAVDLEAPGAVAGLLAQSGGLEFLLGAAQG